MQIDRLKAKQTWWWSGVLAVVVAKRKQQKCCGGNVGGVGGGGCSKRKNLRKSELTELSRKRNFIYEITRNGSDVIDVIT